MKDSEPGVVITLNDCIASINNTSVIKSRTFATSQNGAAQHKANLEPPVGGPWPYLTQPCHFD